MTPINIT